MRWPSGVDFIPLLEASGLVEQVGCWVLGTACAQAASWHAAGRTIGIAVNASARQLEDDQVVDDIAAALAATGLSPGSLTIEITESAIMRDARAIASRLGRISYLSVKITIDDFGTSYSSLAHLQRFPVDALKIDRSFIAGLSGRRDGVAFIRTLVDVGKALAIKTVAEGIEHAEDLSLVQDESCDGGRASCSRGLSTPATSKSFSANTRQACRRPRHARRFRPAERAPPTLPYSRTPRQNAFATASARSLAPSFSNRWCWWLLTVGRPR